MKYVGMLLIVLAMAGFASALVAAPEIDGSSLVSGVVLISGAVLIARGRRKS
ncbi:MAG: hypothetical protein ABI811_11930 [Acidobacteriota bacterium]